MNLPVAPVMAPPCPDPYGLWEFPPAGQGEALSFGELAAPTDADAEVASVWRLDLSSGDPTGGKAELVRRAQKLAAIDAGLGEASLRLDTFLAGRKQPGGSGNIAFGLDEEQPALPAAEAGLASALAAIEEQARAEGAVDFGIAETAAQIAGAVGINWNGLQGQLNGLIDGVNRQLLHAAWVETTLDGQLVARTTITWGGDLTTCIEPGLASGTIQAHRASLDQAVASEAANLKTVLTVAQLAGKIALAAATPLGAIQALALAYQFVKTVVRISGQGPVAGGQ